MFQNISTSYICNFYCYLFEKKRKEFFIFLIITFIFSLLPYIVVFSSIITMDEVNQRSFFGDGSIISLCSGILCSYFAILFEFKSEDEKKDNIIIYLILILFYICLLFVFYKCQLNFNRSWEFICCIIILSAFVLIVTLFSAMYINFKSQIQYSDLEKYILEKKKKKVKKDSGNTKISKNGTQV